MRQPAATSYERRLPDRIQVSGVLGPDGVGLRADIQVKGRLHRSAEYLVLCLATAVLAALAGLLCHLEQAPSWITGVTSLGIAVATFVAGVWFVSPRRSVQCPPSTTMTAQPATHR